MLNERLSLLGAHTPVGVAHATIGVLVDHARMRLRKKLGLRKFAGLIQLVTAGMTRTAARKS